MLFDGSTSLPLSTITDPTRFSISTKTIRNTESARISVPPLFVPNDKYNPDGEGTCKFVWRTPLRSTAPYWTSEFLFLPCT